jgi:hypothetical protein
MEMLHMKGLKALHNLHDIVLDRVPTPLEEQTGETIRAGSFVNGHLVNGVFDFVFGEGVPKLLKGRLVEVEFLPIEILFPRLAAADDPLEVAMNNVLFFNVMRDPSLVMLEAVNMVFPTSSIDL